MFTDNFVISSPCLYPFFEINFPFLIIRISKALNLCMPDYTCGIKEREFTGLVVISCRENPMAVTFVFKVFSFNPVFAFIWVSTYSPFPQ